MDGLSLAGTLSVPDHAAGLVLFVHGSGGSRFSRRNRYVADVLHRKGLATLLFDLFTEEEERIDADDLTLRFDVGMLSERLIAATDAVFAANLPRGLPVGYFGGGTGAAAALIAAARRANGISAVVSRGGRPDFAAASLYAVRAPTLLIVGGSDAIGLHVNRDAAPRIKAAHRVAVIPGATHMFEERGALEEVANLAAEWFLGHFTEARAKHAS
ncbi:MAG TPA: hypothetical protein VLB44_14245 [Kofleriaceae bacterium]|nr:hypothetical protein [Kofleriaceae bacterium]